MSKSFQVLRDQTIERSNRRKQNLKSMSLARAAGLTKLKGKDLAKRYGEDVVVRDLESLYPDEFAIRYGLFDK